MHLGSRHTRQYRRKPGRLAWACVLLCVVSVVAVQGCRCGAADAVAKVQKHTGNVERDESDRVGVWSRAANGTALGFGDGVRTLRASTASLSLAGGAELAMTPQTMIRFLREMTEGTVALDVEVGEARLTAGPGALRVMTTVGALSIAPNSGVAMRREDGRTRFTVLVGRVSVQPKNESAIELTVGGSLVVSVGGVVIREAEVPEVPQQPLERADAEAPKVGPLLVSPRGSGVALRTPDGVEWKSLGGGAAMAEPGTSLRIDVGSSAVVSRGATEARLGPGEFQVGQSGAALVRVTRGPVRLTTPGAAVRVPGGIIVAKGPAPSANVMVGSERTVVELHRGRADITGSERTLLSPGEHALLLPDGTTSVQGRGPAHAHLLVPAGGTVTIHDPAPPTVIAMQVPPSCPDGAIAKTGNRQWAFRDGEIHVPLEAGRHPYKLHCLATDGPHPTAAAQGTVTVLHDSGVTPIPEKAPRTQLETDGRAYTVLYQNRLPIISVRWSLAPPEAASYQLHVSGPSGTRAISTTTPSYVFPSGSLREGNHSLHFAADAVPPRRSRSTKLGIVYDPATPTASIQNAPGSLPPAGATATIAGSAAPGWSVAVDGIEVPVDGHSRFRVATVMPANGRALAIAFHHPKRGVHYYLRRPTGER